MRWRLVVPDDVRGGSALDEIREVAATASVPLRAVHGSSYLDGPTAIGSTPIVRRRGQ